VVAWLQVIWMRSVLEEFTEQFIQYRSESKIYFNIQMIIATYYIYV